jgi:hypothetical protein
MSSEVLIIPDIHGRSFWKEPCESWKGNIVFLGDYHDPYGHSVGEPDAEESLANLKELSDLVKQRESDHPYSIICLLGNHDCSYYTGRFKCRYDYSHSEEVLELIKKLNPQISYELWYDTKEGYNKYLFTHAGVTKNWLDYHQLEDASTLTIDSLDILEEVPFSRGGESYYGSPIWNSLEDFQDEEHLPEYYQIFGHTWGGRTEPVITNTYAMLDCGKAFVLDLATKKITEWSK